MVSAGGVGYGYDANGNLISRGGATVAWTSYNLPASIGDPSGYVAQFSYAPDRSRWRQVSTYAGGSETTIYVSGLLEKLTTATRTHWKHLIPTPSGQVQVIRRSDGTSETLYVTTDSLGSTDAVLSAAGAVLMRGSFSVHGARRASNWQGTPSGTEWQAIANTTRRGYTGHEQLDNVMLVHMNGRVFDPVIGRFLSADPYIDGPETTQGWNRYAYVQGRVMSATDPTGYEAFNREEVVVPGRRILGDPDCGIAAIACNVSGYQWLLSNGSFGPMASPLAPSSGGSGPIPPQTRPEQPLEEIVVTAPGGDIAIESPSDEEFLSLMFGSAGFSADMLRLLGSGMSVGSNGALYRRGWTGSGSVSTVRLARLAHGLGTTFLFLGTAVDAKMLYDGNIGPGEAGANLAFGLLAVANPYSAVASLGYFGLQSSYPGGAAGALTDWGQISLEMQTYDSLWNHPGAN